MEPMRLSISTSLALCATISAACGPDAPDGLAGPDRTDEAPGDGGTPPPNEPASAMLALVNDVRAAGAICGDETLDPAPPLRLEARLGAAAQAHAEDMAAQDYFDHTSDGRDLSDRVDATGYAWRAIGENIAAGRAEADETFQQWLTSPGHCRNMLNPRFMELGVGYAFSPGATYQHYWTQNLGRPRAL